MLHERLNGRGSFYPDLLTPQVERAKADLASCYLYGFDQKPLRSFRREVVKASLDGFLQAMNGGFLDFMAEGYRKQGVKNGVPSGRFVLSSPLTSPEKRGALYIHIDDATFYLDSEFGFVLGFQREGEVKPLWLAITSFLPSHRIGNYKAGLSCEEKNVPVIVQLQGASRAYTYERERQREVASLLNVFYWEHLLVSCSLQWMSGTEFEEVFLLPAWMNRYYEKGDFDSRKRLFRRYDETAETFGFRKGEHGFYMYDLTPAF